MIGKKIEKNNVTIALNVLYAKKEKLYPAYVSKPNSNREKQVILLMVPNKEKHQAKSKESKAKSEGQRRWHYLALKKIINIIKRNNIKK